MSQAGEFDPYAIFEALDREGVGYVVVGGFARVVHGSAETTRGLDLVPSPREENVRRLARAFEELGATGPEGEPFPPDALALADPTSVRTRAGEVRVVATPWGTRGYDDLRIRSFRENLGRGVRPSVASLVDCVRMLEASEREPDQERLYRLRRLMELERQLVPQRRLGLER
ncbi:MAG: hypothetical protein ACR2M2_03830 [Gaiellaceae bacterium]